MEELIQRIIQNSKNKAKPLNPRQLFFREFDLAIQVASQGMPLPVLSDHVLKLEEYGRKAGLSQEEWTSRKNTLYWTLAQAN